MTSTTHQPGVYVTAQAYTFDQLAAIYNAARVDYIVPMPMNGKRMADYVRDYDIDLDASTVALNAESTPTGVIMMGIRNGRAWITRLGVVPETRGCKVGQRLVEVCIEKAEERHLRWLQLEVIKGNEPAYQLFQKLGFAATRELLVVRRPPGPVDDRLAAWCAGVTHAEALPAETLPAYLAQAAQGRAWTEEPASFSHMPNLAGLGLILESGERGWAIFQQMPFQLMHLIVDPGASQSMRQALLFSLHQRFPKLDFKIENVPVDDPIWPVMQALGYLEAFRRVEMVRPVR